MSNSSNELRRDEREAYLLARGQDACPECEALGLDECEGHGCPECGSPEWNGSEAACLACSVRACQEMDLRIGL